MTTPTSRRNALKFIGLGSITTAIAPSALLQACREAASTGAAAGLATLNAIQAKTLGAIQDAILPRTDTPSATDLGSVQFVDTWLTHGYEAADRDRFLYRLDKFAELLQAEDSVDPAAATPEQVTGMLDRYYVDYKAAAATDNTMEIEGNTVERQDDDTYSEEMENAANEQVEEAIVYQDDATEINSVLVELRGLTFESYFQSEQIGEQVLNYDEVPGEWIGSYPMSQVPNGRAWSL